MFAAKVLISVLIVVMMTAGVAVCYSQKWLKENFEEENRIRAEHPCGRPQNRTVYLHEIVGNEIWEQEYKDNMKNVYPFGVILGRCENSGCCKRYNERCKPENERDVNVTFLVKSGNKFDYKTHVAKDHLSCQCQVVSEDQIK